MPKFFAQDILSKPILDPEHEIESSLDTPELSPPEPSYDKEYPEQTSGVVKTLLTWKAPARPFRKKDRSYYTTIAILVTLISLILFLAGEKLLIGVLLALVFLVYVLSFIPPEEIEYKLSTQGVTIHDHFYHWQQLDSFWFEKKDGIDTLHILTLFRFPGVLTLVLDSIQTEEVKKICAKFLPFQEIPPKSQIEKWADSLQKHFPLEHR